eukprot:m.55684 g.55684  ORF g.55684 m.55684 type:complete len:399 (+) comp7763_c1_seq1:220-1416(+)
MMNNATTMILLFAAATATVFLSTSYTTALPLSNSAFIGVRVRMYCPTNDKRNFTAFTPNEAVLNERRLRNRLAFRCFGVDKSEFDGCLDSTPGCVSGTDTVTFAMKDTRSSLNLNRCIQSALNDGRNVKSNGCVIKRSSLEYTCPAGIQYRKSLMFTVRLRDAFTLNDFWSRRLGIRIAKVCGLSECGMDLWDQAVIAINTNSSTFVVPVEDVVYAAAVENCLVNNTITIRQMEVESVAQITTTTVMPTTTTTTVGLVGADTCPDAVRISTADFNLNTFLGSTSGFTDDYDISTAANPCLPANSRGKDVVYVIGLQTGDSISVTLTASDGQDVAIWISTSCATLVNSCVLGVDVNQGNSMPETISYTATATGDVFIVVDGYANAEGAYSLKVTYTASP